MGILYRETFDDYGPYRGHPADPRTDDDDIGAAFEDAEGIAQDEFLATPANVAQWLAKVTDTPAGWKPITFAADPLPTSMTTAELLALLVSGTERQAREARYVLRDRYIAAHKTEIAARVADIMREAV